MKIQETLYSLVQGVSRETDDFEIYIIPLIFSVEFIYYHEMIRYYVPFCVIFALLYFLLFPIRQHVADQNGWTPHDGLSHSFHVLRGSCSCDRTRWFLLHYRSSCSKRRDPPQGGIATWNVPMTPDSETATKEPLSFSN